MNRITMISLATMLAASLSACAGPSVPDGPIVDSRGNQPRESRLGSVDSIAPVARSSIPTGAIVGAVIGGLLGSQIGGGNGRIIGGGVGAAGGAVLGNTVEKNANANDQAYRVGVRFDDGSVTSYNYHRVDDLRVGDRVRLDGGQLHRI